MSDRPKNRETSARRAETRVVSDLASLRLIRKGNKEEIAADDRSIGARVKIEAGLKELRAVTSLAEYERARTAGVAFSVDGFRSRCHVGSSALRITNFDFFEQLQNLLNYIHSEYLKVPRSKTGRSRGPAGTRKKTLSETRIVELETLLDRQELDFKVLLEELRLLRGNVAV